MKIYQNAILAMAMTAVMSLSVVSGEPAANTLTAKEKAGGWQLLFDGKSADQWRSFGKADLPASGWEVADGWLVKKGSANPGNIVTRKKFSDFEFSWEWRLAEGGNNGVKYFVDEMRGNLGHEYQMLSSASSKQSKGSTAGFYAVLAPREEVPVKIAPEVNHSRIVVEGARVRHWLNGVLVLEYECGSKEVLEGVASSKFKKVKDFGQKLTAHLMLTDHGSECSFRNLKIRRLPVQ